MDISSNSEYGGKKGGPLSFSLEPSCYDAPIVPTNLKLLLFPKLQNTLECQLPSILKSDELSVNLLFFFNCY